ncbi:hypothetical protein EVAR_93492_1 [Eumeta japonica]|uniref:Mos1 transposase HTH domain-containing protein n=1 Tax=Eumeta variegata TaxID=151549 RepID=A0A4C1TJD3_EUMVA|nr:hypothetical protein EVAR_93492_1 [Eumeta japonica]
MFIYTVLGLLPKNSIKGSYESGAFSSRLLLSAAVRDCLFACEVSVALEMRSLKGCMTLSRVSLSFELLLVMKHHASSTIYNWFAEFKRARVNPCDESPDGCPSTAMNNKNINTVHRMIEIDRREHTATRADLCMPVCGACPPARPFTAKAATIINKHVMNDGRCAGGRAKKSARAQAHVGSLYELLTRFNGSENYIGCRL